MKPTQYNIGIDTFERARANLTTNEVLACCRFNIDKYCWRKKDQDLSDFNKIIAYCKYAIETLEVDNFDNDVLRCIDDGLRDD